MYKLTRIICLKSRPSVLRLARSRPLHIRSIASPMTRWCRPDQVTQQPGDAEVCILIENVYKFKGSGAKKLIRKFSDKGWNVKSLNNLFLKGSGRPSLVFTRYSTNL